VNSQGEKPKSLPEIELKEGGSTMERFASMTRRLLFVSHEDVKKAEAQFKADQKARKRAPKVKTDK